MRVAVVGAGSIGAVLGAKLAATGHEVTLIARGAHLAAIRGKWVNAGRSRRQAFR